jgi:hypothetical protein
MTIQVTAVEDMNSSSEGLLPAQSMVRQRRREAAGGVALRMQYYVADVAVNRPNLRRQAQPCTAVRVIGVPMSSCEAGQANL